MFLAFYPGEIPLRIMWLVFSIFFQFIALMWYSLTYIPFANQIIVGMLKRLCCDCSIFDERSVSRVRTKLHLQLENLFVLNLKMFLDFYRRTIFGEFNTLVDIICM